MNIYKTVSRIVCRCSLIKSDNCRLKRKLQSDRICTNCDLCIIENVRAYRIYVVICSVKYSGLAIRRNTKIILELNANNVFRYLLGNHTNSLDEEEIIYAVRISEIAKYNIYRSVVMSRKLGSQLNS